MTPFEQDIARLQEHVGTQVTGQFDPETARALCQKLRLDEIDQEEAEQRLLKRMNINSEPY